MHKDRFKPLSEKSRKLIDFLKEPAPECIKLLTSMAGATDSKPELKNTNLGFMLRLGFEAVTMVENSAVGPNRLEAQHARELMQIAQGTYDNITHDNFGDNDIIRMRTIVTPMRAIAAYLQRDNSALQEQMAGAEKATQRDLKILAKATQEILADMQTRVDAVKLQFAWAQNRGGAAELRAAFSSAAALTQETPATARQRVSAMPDNRNIILQCEKDITRNTALHAGILDVAAQLDGVLGPPTTRPQQSAPSRAASLTRR